MFVLSFILFILTPPCCVSLPPGQDCDVIDGRGITCKTLQPRPPINVSYYYQQKVNIFLLINVTF